MSHIPINAPLTAEVAQMVTRLRGQDAIPNRNEVADMITALATENATLRAERDTFRAVLDGAGYPVDDIAENPVEKSFALGHYAAELTIAIRSDRDDLRASEAAAMERVKVLEAQRNEFRDLFLAGCAPFPVSSDIADVVAAVEEWVNQRGGEDTADQIAVMAIQSYQRSLAPTALKGAE